MDQKPVKVQSVSRALQLLELLQRSLSPLSAVELSQKTGLNRSTVHSLLDTLIACGYVQLDVAQGKYYASIKMYALSSSYADRMPFVKYCVPIARKLALEYNLSLNLGVLTHDGSLLIIKEYLPVGYNYHEGGYQHSFYASAVGKIYLAFLPEAQSAQLIEELKLEPFTQYTIRDKDVLRKELEKIRRCGYATNPNELVYGHASVAFPVFDADRNLAGAFSYSYLTSKITELPPRFLDEGLQVSRDCSIEMGCAMPPVFFIDEDPS